MSKLPQQDAQAARKEGGYPYLPLASVIKIAEAVSDCGGANGDVSKSVLAGELHEDEKSPGFSQKITSAKVYGLITGHGAYTLTELGRDYFSPKTDTARAIALLSAFNAPSAFKELIRRFDGQKIPSRELLGNLLQRDIGVPESWKDRVAGYFLQAAESVAAIHDGYLRYKYAFQLAGGNSAPPPAGTPLSGEISKPPLPPPTPPGSHLPSSDKPSMDTVRLSYNGKYIELSVPEPLESQLWDKLSRHVQALKPQEGAK